MKMYSSRAQIPNATSLVQLSLPHFGIGLGIGAVDCALIPMLANYADLQQNIHYGLVYALQQVVTSSSYICGNHNLRFSFPISRACVGVCVILMERRKNSQIMSTTLYRAGNVIYLKVAKKNTSQFFFSFSIRFVEELFGVSFLFFLAYI